MFLQRFFYQLTFISILLIFFSTCALPNPEKPAKHEVVQLEIPPHARFLKDIKICLDPGHGGQSHIPDYKRGPTGLREAEINLKVAFYLRDLLEKVDAKVILTRTDDSYVSLAERSQIANENHVDFFISIHHNGIDNKPEINYTSTWYHGDADDSRPSLDLARYIQQGVSDAIQLSTSPPTGLYSDKLIVASGFGVLRLTKCPAIVCEASFYTNPEEETRLKQDNYLKKEAYGYFLGLARYAEAGFPKGVLITPKHESVIQNKTPTIQIKVMDGIHERGAWILKRQQVFSNSIQVLIDNVAVPFNYDRETDIISVKIKEPLSNGIHFVHTELVNYYANHSLPKPQQFKVAPPAEELIISSWTGILPYDGKSYVRIKVNALDVDGMPIADGELLQAKSTHGTLADIKKLSKSGNTYFYLFAPEKSAIATVEVHYGQIHNYTKIKFTDVTHGILQGRVSDANSNDAIPNVTLVAKSVKTTSTDVEGHYFIETNSKLKLPIGTYLHITKQGYYPEKHQITIEPNKATLANVKLHAIADGAFSETVIILDTKTDTPKSHKLISILKDMLELAGTKVHVVATQKSKMSIDERIQTVNKIKDDGYYMQINHSNWEDKVSLVIATHNRGNQETETMLKKILTQFNKRLFETPILTIQDKDTPIIQQTNKLAMTLEIRSLNKSDINVEKEAATIFQGIWLFLKAKTEIDEEKYKRFMLYFNDMMRGE